MRKRWFRVVVIVALILLPVGIWWFDLDIVQPLFRTITDYPKTVTIPTGPAAGRHNQITKSLRADISAKLDVKPGSEVKTVGSLQNLRALQEGKIHLAIYQAGTGNSEFKNLDKNRDRQLSLVEFQGDRIDEQVRAFKKLDENNDDFLSLDEFKSTSSIAFVANIYSEVAHFVVRRDAEIKHPGDLRDKRVALGMKDSGHYAMSRILLKHFGLEEKDIQAKYDLDYAQIEDALHKEDIDEDEKLDAAFLTMGIRAEIFSKLFATGKCDLLPIRYAEALTSKNVLLSNYEIPAGLYRFQPEAVPAQNVQTVAFQGQLLTRNDVNSHFIQDVTGIVLDKHFASQNTLHELLKGGEDFAKAKPAFAVHPGAQSVYDSEFDIHLIESWEAGYSLAVSTVIAAFFGVKWLRQRRARKKEHKLDRYIRSLLEIEERQVGLDHGAAEDDLERLQKLLDEVTFLAHNALREFSAHELNEDRGADCFIEMCHDLSNKINAKISRQRLDSVIHCLIETTKDGATSREEHSVTATDLEEATSQVQPDR